jgi:hypothetical protein
MQKCGSGKDVAGTVSAVQGWKSRGLLGDIKNPVGEASVTDPVPADRQTRH